MLINSELFNSKLFYLKSCSIRRAAQFEVVQVKVAQFEGVLNWRRSIRSCWILRRYATAIQHEMFPEFFESFKFLGRGKYFDVFLSPNYLSIKLQSLIFCPNSYFVNERKINLVEDIFKFSFMWKYWFLIVADTSFV